MYLAYNYHSALKKLFKREIATNHCCEELCLQDTGPWYHRMHDGLQ